MEANKVLKLAADFEKQADDSFTIRHIPAALQELSRSKMRKEEAVRLAQKLNELTGFNIFYADFLDKG